MIDLSRSAIATGKIVNWQNAIGMYLGQSGKYTFATDAAAQRFADYAGQEDAPPLSDHDLTHAGIPLPIKREEP